MAQFFTDFTGATVGATPPTGWTERWAASGGFDVASGPVVTYLHGSTVNDFLSWDTVGSVSGDVEIVVLCRSSDDLGVQMGAVIQGSITETDGYTIALSGPSLVLFAGRQDDGVNTDISFPAFTWAVDTDYWIRFGKSGNTVRARVWADGGSEPGTWLISATDSTYSAGYVGLYANNLNGTKTFKAFGVGTGGDAAPTAPVSSASIPRLSYSLRQTLNN